MAKATYQILSNEALNSKGFVVLNSSIDWSRYLKNPILLRNKDTGEHFGQPIGRVEDIHLENGRGIGKLVFGTRTGRKKRLRSRNTQRSIYIR